MIRKLVTLSALVLCTTQAGTYRLTSEDHVFVEPSNLPEDPNQRHQNQPLSEHDHLANSNNENYIQHSNQSDNNDYNKDAAQTFEDNAFGELFDNTQVQNNNEKPVSAGVHCEYIERGGYDIEKCTHLSDIVDARIGT